MIHSFKLYGGCSQGDVNIADINKLVKELLKQIHVFYQLPVEKTLRKAQRYVQFFCQVQRESGWCNGAAKTEDELVLGGNPILLLLEDMPLNHWEEDMGTHHHRLHYVTWPASTMIRYIPEQKNKFGMGWELGWFDFSNVFVRILFLDGLVVV